MKSNSQYRNAYWLLFCEDKLVTVKKGDGFEIPLIDNIDILGTKPSHMLPMGEVDGCKCYTGYFPADLNTEVPKLNFRSISATVYMATHPLM